MARPNLKKFRRIVVKVGSSLLIDSDAGEVRASWLAALAADLAKLHGEGRELLIVSSGSIALGRSRLKLPRGTLKLEESQAAAAVGQIALARIWSEVLGHHGIGAGQILVTLQDTEERRRYLNARSTIAKLLEWRAVPVINENDTVATNEIRYGDNDRLAARVATMASARSDSAGALLYPARSPGSVRRRCRDRPAPPTRFEPARSVPPRPRPDSPRASRAARQFQALRPSAIEPDETIRTSRPSPCSFAISAVSAESHDARTSPASESIRSEEPTLTTMRRKFFRSGGPGWGRK